MPSNDVCTCGHQISSSDDLQSSFGDQKRQEIGSSFVHLPSSVPPKWEGAGNSSSHDGFLQALRNTETLLRIASSPRGNTAITDDDDDDDGYKEPLCIDCLDRILNAIHADTERLNDECEIYRREMKLREERERAIQRSLSSTLFPPSPREELSDGEDDDVAERAEATFRDEISLLKNAIEQHEQELAHMKSLERDQGQLRKDLHETESSLAQQYNALQLEARSFDFSQKQHFDKLLRAQHECDVLQEVQLHSTLFDLVVDKRGLRYPLINQLRLAFCPKGDVQWSEINAAWSQAAQLLFLIGSSFEFRTQSWRIVPLTKGAKLMHLDGQQRKHVYNLAGREGGKGMAASLRAFNALLEELLGHSKSIDPPFTMTRSTIGTIDLSKLPDADDPGWSRAIHCTACNLQHLSTLASNWEKGKLE